MSDLRIEAANYSYDAPPESAWNILAAQAQAAGTHKCQLSTNWVVELSMEAIDLSALPGELVCSFSRNDYFSATLRDNDWFCYLTLSSNDCTVNICASDYELARKITQRFKKQLPEIDRENDPRVEFTFWSLSKDGPRRLSKMLEIAQWNEITHNYNYETRAKLDYLLSLTSQGTSGAGKLILWNGNPGGGKTWAIRALANQWRDWAQFHYITDPESFFGGSANYMVNVLLDHEYETSKWRVLILEDTGELLARDAKQQTGQGLSRLLNVCDGLIGQGLKILLLMTTNEDLGALHPAVIRPGRCLSRIEFKNLGKQEAREWLDVMKVDLLDVDTAQFREINESSTVTLAQLYALKSGVKLQPQQQDKVGFYL